jgi:hypothetical protein
VKAVGQTHVVKGDRDWNVIIVRPRKFRLKLTQKLSFPKNLDFLNEIASKVRSHFLAVRIHANEVALHFVGPDNEVKQLSESVLPHLTEAFHNTGVKVSYMSYRREV